MGIVIDIHRILSNTIWLFFLLLGLWGLYKAYRQEAVDGGYLGAMVIAEGLFIVQAVLGTIIGISNGSIDRIHVLYGVFGIVFLPFIYFYAKYA